MRRACAKPTSDCLRSGTTAGRLLSSTSGDNFYDTILQIGGNLELKRMLPLMQIHLLRMQFQAYITPRDREKQFEEYQTITETIFPATPMRARKGRVAAHPAHAPESHAPA